MKREDVERVRKLFDPYGNQPGFGPALDLVEHVTQLQAFVCDLAAWFAAPESARPVGERHRLHRRCEALRLKIEPPRGYVNGR
jgi:hypothetical protein